MRSSSCVSPFARLGPNEIKTTRWENHVWKEGGGKYDGAVNCQSVLRNSSRLASVVPVAAPILTRHRVYIQSVHHRYLLQENTLQILTGQTLWKTVE